MPNTATTAPCPCVNRLSGKVQKQGANEELAAVGEGRDEAGPGRARGRMTLGRTWDVCGADGLVMGVTEEATEA